MRYALTLIVGIGIGASFGAILPWRSFVDMQLGGIWEVLAREVRPQPLTGKQLRDRVLGMETKPVPPAPR